MTVRQRVPGRARKRDANEPEIIEALELCGAVVYPVDKPLDLVVIYAGLVWLLEVKNGNQPPSWQRVTPEQKEFLDLVGPHTGQVAVVNSPQQALHVIGQADSYIKMLEQFWLEVSHVHSKGSGWFTNGEAGASQHVRNWIEKIRKAKEEFEAPGKNRAKK